MIVGDDVVDILWNPVKADEKSLLIFECLELVDSFVIIRLGILMMFEYRIFGWFSIVGFSVLFCCGIFF